MGEAIWLNDDQDKVAAFLQLEREVCSRCGTLESDWVDGTGRYRDDPPYEAVVLRCHGCERLEQTMGEIPEQEKGVRVVLIPTGGVLREA